MKKVITYFDHSDTARNKVISMMQDDSLIVCPYQINPINHDCDGNALDEISFSNGNVVMVHMNPDELNTLIEKVSDGCVLLCLSTNGRKDKHFTTKNNGFCLNLRLKHDVMKQSEWCDVLNAITTTKTVKKIIAGDVPPDLHRYFGEPTKGEILALSILCQGYLCAWAYSESLLENQKSEIDSTIKTALDKMGFDKIYERKDDLAVLLEEIQKKYLGDGTGVVECREWWQVFASKASEAIADERDACGISGTDFEKVSCLATWIDDGVDALSPELVAAAYCEIKAQEKNLAS